MGTMLDGATLSCHPVQGCRGENRVYDPATGRFTQEDPIGLAGGLNLYGFANGDPVNFSDPFGLRGCGKDEPCPSLIDQVNKAMGDAVADLATSALQVTAGIVNAATSLGDFFTAAGLNPNGQGTGARMGAGAMALAGTLGGAGERGAAKLVERLGGETGNFRHAVKALGIDKRAASAELHAIKKAAGLGGADNVWIHTGTGDVRSQKGGELIGNLIP